jgi:hypothetical protein
MNARQLALRDPAKAAIMGAITGDSFGFGADYGASRPVNDVNRPRRPAPQFSHVGFGDDYGFGAYEYGDDYGFGSPDYGDDYGFGAAKRRPAPRRPARPGAAPAAWNPTSTESRTMLLDPNRNSTVKVTGYSFSFSPTALLTLGTAASLGTFTQQPSTSIKGRRVVTNAPATNFVLLTALQIANVNVFVGTTEDAYTYNANGVNIIMDLPRLDPQNRATASGTYTGILPPGYSAGGSFQFIITLQGPSTLAGGYGQ